MWAWECDMQQMGARPESRRAEGSVAAAKDLAAEVVAQLAARAEGGRALLSDPMFQAFEEAARSPDPMAFEALKPELRRARISASVLCDLFIPEVARRLGVDWEDDRASFAEVTMGAARLQAILRDISATWSADLADARREMTLLLVVPKGEQHTLGPLVLAGMLRRRGVSVCLQLGADEGELVRLLQARKFDAAMLSTACTDKVDVCKAMVSTLKTCTDGTLKVAMGGAILDLCREDVHSVGADIATNDIDAALSAFGMTTRRERLLERT
jgi:MerR family transcriptional regulator, light-induced transcriptional regulator